MATIPVLETLKTSLRLSKMGVEDADLREIAVNIDTSYKAYSFLFKENPASPQVVRNLETSLQFDCARVMEKILDLNHQYKDTNLVTKTKRTKTYNLYSF